MKRRSRSPPVITLLSDFGNVDVYAGVMKGVIASLAPRSRVVDLTHAIAPQDVLQGGLRWASAVDYFPRGSIHVAVVDPGVGGPRKILAVRARGSVFLAPDNGLIGFVARAEEIEEAVLVLEPKHFLSPVSRTFHGRDIFAPVAARLSLGLPLRSLGPPAAEMAPSPLPALEVSAEAGGERVRGEIVDIDNFGNCITNIPAGYREDLQDIRVGRWRLGAPEASYGGRRPGEPLAIAGSSGYLEIAVRLGRADRALGLRRGQRVSALRPRKRSSGSPHGGKEGLARKGGRGRATRR